jgi:hypothetical protein
MGHDGCRKCYSSDLPPWATTVGYCSTANVVAHGEYG